MVEELYRLTKAEGVYCFCLVPAEPTPPTDTYNVKDYGALGDGRTDDTSAIERAINSMTGSTLYFPAGTYIVKAPAPGTERILSLSKGVKVCGDGVGVSTIKVANACPTYQWLLGPATAGTDLTGLEICDLTFDHNIANNAITNNAEIMAWPEFTCGAYLGSNVNIHDIEVINASSVNNIVANGVGNASITIDNIHCSVMGDDPNHVDHDASFIYIDASNYSISNCNLSCATPALPGGGSAIECHGTTYTVTNNTVTNWGGGVLATGVALTATENVTVSGNVISGCDIGVYIWSCQYLTHTTGYGINGMNIHDNTIDINVVGGVGDTRTRGGVYIYPVSDLDINNLHIYDNVITGTLETVAGGQSDISIGIGWYDAYGLYTLSNSSITGNNISDFPNSGIRLSCNLDAVSVTGNTLTDTGSTMAAVADPYRTPIFVWPTDSDTLDISDNILVDDIAVTRIPYFCYFGATTTSDALTVDANTFSITGDEVVFVKHIEVAGVVSRPTLTGTIGSFTPPTGNVKSPATSIIDGATAWTVDVDETTWTQT